MYMNLVVLGGHLAAPPEIREFESGSRLVRYLVTVKCDEPLRRIDVLPVTLWDPDDSLLAEDPKPGRPLWLTGTAQRRFWEGPDGRRSRIEIIASSVTFREPVLMASDGV